jgi:hypothetical protein
VILRLGLGAIVVTVLVFLCGISTADPRGYNIRGSIVTSCGEAVHTLAHREKSERDRVNGFFIAESVWGYLAAYNARGVFGDPTRVRDEPSVEPPDEQTVYLFVDGYCSRHPTAAVISAADALIRSEGGRVYIPPGLE